MYTVTVNGQSYSEAEDLNLLDFLRRRVRATSVKNGCGEGVCGACKVLVDGRGKRACRLTLSQVDGSAILTVEGLTKGEQEAYVRAFTEAGAVQCGFCTPGMVISAKELLDRNPAPTPEEIRQAIKGNICRCTGYVKIVKAITLAAALLRGEPGPQPDRGEGIGVSLSRIDAREKVLGKGMFVDDLQPAEVLYGAVLRTKYPRALIKGMATEAARNYPGVAAVLTAEDIPGQRYWGFLAKDWPVLVAVGEETRYIGDALALVAADSERTAREALRLIQVDYQILEPVTSVCFALTEEAPKIHPAGNIVSTTRIKRGDAAAALAAADYVVSRHYRLPMTEHAFLEPESALAVPDGEGGLTVHVGSQSVYEDQKGIMAILGLPADKVRVIGHLVGGAFGGKEDLSVQHYAALLAQKTGRPVKVTLSRQESILTHPKRHAMEIDLTTGCDREGKLTAISARIISDNGAYASLGAPVLQRCCTHIGGPYHLPHADIIGVAVYTNHPPAGAFRGFGVPQAAFACETNLDLLARRVGISPWEIRYRNALEPGLTNAAGQIADQGTAIKETLLAVKDDYYSCQKVGIACAIKNTGLGVGVPDIGRVRLLVEGGRVKVLTSAACVGQGLATVLLQIVSEATGLPVELFDYHSPDTDLTPDAGTTTASRQTLFTGEAARQAALRLHQALARQSLAQLEGAQFDGEYEGDTDPLDSDKPHPVHHVAYSYATHLVFLDETGRVSKVVAAHDVGRAINPQAIEGQIEGAVAMGLGYALRENFPLHRGVPQVRYGTLGLFRADEMPEMKVILIEKNPSPLAFGAKGVGEIADIPVAPAVASAYYAFDGRERTELPLAGTPYRKQTGKGPVGSW